MAEIYRADHVGSLLRPAEVREARAAFRDDRLDADGLREIEIAPSWTRWNASGPPASSSIPTASFGGRGFRTI